jgi:3-hydroxyacyl-[acyl-carrier-protein] dehydratase
MSYALRPDSSSGTAPIGDLEATPRRTIGFSELKEKYLPHRYPLLLLDRVTHYVPGEFIEGVKCVTGNSPEMVGHFPERAILPGTAILQAFAQLAIVFLKVSSGGLRDDEITLITSISARFLAPVPPGETLLLRIAPKRLTRDAGILNCDARIGDKSVARGSLTISKAKLDRFADVPW